MPRRGMLLEELQGRFDELEQRLSRLTEEHAALQRRYKELQEKSRKQQQRIGELEEQLAKARKTSRNSSKPPSSDIVKKPPPAADLPDGGRRKRGGQPGHPRHERPDMAPDEIDAFVDCSLDVCPCCGEQLIDLDRPPEVLHQIELPEKPVHTTEHRRSTKWCGKCKKEITPAWPPGLEELLRLLPDEDRLNIDETGHKDGGKRLWTWCFRAATFALFKISPSRGSDVLLEVLGKEFDGVIGCDYFSAYRKYMRLNDNVRVQFCLAHLIRDVKFLAEHPDAKNRAYGQRLLALLRKLFHIIHRRDEYATPAGFRTALARVRTDLVWAATMDSPHTREASALEERFYRHTASYFQFLTDPDIDPTNNVVEQAFRFVAIQRRITQGTRGQTGQTWSERIWTVVATCEQQGRSIFDYLVDAVISHFTHQAIPSLLPEPSNSS